jgi:hypothetical protein
MWHNFLSYIKTELKELIAAAIVLLLVVLSFLAYLKFVGLPMTRARNTYNEGMLIWSTGDTVRAKQKFEDSLSYWKTSEAQAALDRLSGQQGMPPLNQ